MDLVSLLLPNNNNLAPHFVHVALALLAILIIRTTRHRDRVGDLKIAPEASGRWPLIGHLHLLASDVPPHRILGGMADKYGPIFNIRLGRKPTIVVSSSEIAKECFGTKDKVFSDRPYTYAVSQVYGGAMFGFGQHSYQYWKNMRRITSHELLSNSHLELFRNLRSYEVKTCIKHLFSLCQAGLKQLPHFSYERADNLPEVDMSDWLSLVSMNIMTRMVVGKSFDPIENEADWRRIVKSTEDILSLMGTYVVTEWIDLKGHFKALKKTIKECDRFVAAWVDEHVRKRKEGRVNDVDRHFLEVMFSMLENDPSLCHPHSPEISIKATILNLILGGVETSATMMKWTLSLLVNRPEALKKAKKEIDDLVGKNRWVEESDMENLPYLVAILKETLRSMIPLSVPRESTRDCTIAGYHVPKGTTLMVNLWKLHHDPFVWSNPEEFRPERFLSDNVGHFNVRDKSFVFIPFASGRRSCPGATSAMQTMSLVIGRVLQGFDLETFDGKNVDMREGLGLTNPRATPLKLILKPRLSHEMY